MPLLLATIVFRFFFGNRFGGALFTILGTSLVLGVLMAGGKMTASLVILAIATVFAAKRAFTRR